MAVVYILNKYTGEVDAVDIPQIVETDPVFLAWLNNTPPLYSETDPVFLSWLPDLASNDNWKWASMVWIEDSSAVFAATTIEAALLEWRFNYAWVYVKPTYTDNLNWTVTIWTWKYALFFDTNFSYPLNIYEITWNTFTLEDQKDNYIVANHNFWTPVIQCTSNRDNIRQSNIVPIFTITRDWISLHIIDWDNMAKWLANKICDRLVRTERFTPEIWWLLLSESATRKINITSWVVRFWAANKICDIFDSSVDNCELRVYDWVSWSHSTITQYNNTQYNWPSWLVSLSTNRYAVNWVYRWVEVDKHVFVVLWTWDYKFDQAIASQPPALPLIMNSQAILVWRIIVFNWANTATQIDSAFSVKFAPSWVTDHAALLNLDYANSWHTWFASKWFAIAMSVAL